MTPIQHRGKPKGGNMEIYAGDRLSTKDLIKKLGISEATWKRNRKDILKNLADSYVYEVEYEGRKTFYKFISTTGEYKTKTEERDEAFETAIIGTLQEKPLNTAKNVSRLINNKYYWPEITSLGYTEGTVYEYTRVRMRKWFGKDEKDTGSFENMEDLKERKGYISQKIWCMLDSEANEYIPMSQEQIDFFLKTVRENFAMAQKEQFEIDIFANFDAGLIDAKERDEKIGEYRYSLYAAAKRAYKERYGHYPIKVPEYVVYEVK